MIIINTIKLIHGDCLDKLKGVKDKSINLVLIDPPYNISKAEWDTWKTVDDYIEFMGQVFLECQRVLKDNGSFYFFHNDFEQMAELQHWIKKSTRFVFKQMVVWDKFNGSKWNQLNAVVYNEANRNYSKQAEYCLYYTFQSEELSGEDENFKSIRDYLYNEWKESGMTKKEINIAMGISPKSDLLGHFWQKRQWKLPHKERYELLSKITGRYKKPYNKLKEEYESLKYTYNNQNLPSVWQHEPIPQNGHITPKPIQILKNIILTSSNEHDMVLDCFMGSCSTGIACLETNRKFTGIELDSGYFETCKNRVNIYIKEQNMKDIHIEIA